ncbi:hypothetical protein V202x_32230 [Gimesia aquarii]|uniref:Uncharacterized protein n=2 Tax=Gimesia aquarii TaxID=2527964 RepID=A0A517WX27_9PLAN|nr:hypothetical protein V202x_32230 [Gimesia aquarii]
MSSNQWHLQRTGKILLTGVCYVHRLLEERFANPDRRFIKDVHPDFDASKVLFFSEEIAQRFLFTDFHGKLSSIKTEANNFPELLELYEDQCEAMYCVGATQIHSLDVPNIRPADFSKISTFWYFLFNDNWNPVTTRKWEEKRDKVLLALLVRFPKLKFIFYQERCKTWWKKHNLPSERMVYWNIDWGMSISDYEDIKRELEKKGIRGGHRFPTEDSYNDLCDLILCDLEKSKAVSLV